MSDALQISMTLFVAGNDPSILELRQNLEETLRQTFGEDGFRLNVVDVIKLPEKALERDVFATPTLIRDLPLPVVKVIGKVAASKSIMALIDRGNSGMPPWMV